ncbi:MAG: hypothetical protein CM15mV142_280 [Caudoviricetes sp.]|nr:MAG: hypothetical protein CM15mV142_280 [Caudoviricetes sp.]
MSHHLEEFGEQWNSSHTKAERTGQARKSLHAYIYKDLLLVICLVMIKDVMDIQQVQPVYKVGLPVHLNK